MPEQSDDIQRADQLTLADLIKRARENGVVRVLEGEDLFELRFIDDRLSDEARDFLLRAGKH